MPALSKAKPMFYSIGYNSPTALSSTQRIAKEKRSAVNHRPRVTHLQIPSMVVTVNSLFFGSWSKYNIYNMLHTGHSFFPLDKMIFWIVTLKPGPCCFERLQNCFYKIVPRCLTNRLQWRSYKNRLGWAHLFWRCPGESSPLYHTGSPLTDSEQSQKKPLLKHLL